MEWTIQVQYQQNVYRFFKDQQFYKYVVRQAINLC